MSKVITISEDKFYNEFKPIQNHIDTNASWDGTLFETYGEELTYCFELSKKENRVWTIVECEEVNEDDVVDEINDVFIDDEEVMVNNFEPMKPCFYIISGFHIVNRVGFLVTEKPYLSDTEVKIEW